MEICMFTHVFFFFTNNLNKNPASSSENRAVVKSIFAVIVFFPLNSGLCRYSGRTGL